MSYVEYAKDPVIRKLNLFETILAAIGVGLAIAKVRRIKKITK
jgi:hypothetical protein